MNHRTNHSDAKSAAASLCLTKWMGDTHDTRARRPKNFNMMVMAKVSNIENQSPGHWPYFPLFQHKNRKSAQIQYLWYEHCYV